MVRRQRHRLAKRLSGRLRRLRAGRDWTQEQAADRCDIVTRHYQKLEAGEVNVTLATLERLGAAFDVDPSDLLAPLEN